MIIAGWERAVCRDRQVKKQLHGYWYRPAGSTTKWWIPECNMETGALASIETEVSRLQREAEERG